MVGPIKAVVVGTTVAIGVYDGVGEDVMEADAVAMGVGEGVMEAGEGVIEADSVALGVGFGGGITSTVLSICLVDCTPSRFVVRISTWTT